MHKQFTPSSAFRIFDSQVNIGTGELEGDAIKSNILADDILRLMSESGIESSLIFPVSRPGGYSEGNKEVADYVRQHPQRFLGFGRIRSIPVRSSSRSFRFPGPGQSTLNKYYNRFPILRKRHSPKFDEECREELRLCFEEYDLKGIKVHPDEDGYPSGPVLASLQSYNKPILLHCGRGISFQRIEEEIIKPFAMPVILAHMGGFPADRKLYPKALALASKYPQVYLNTAFVFYQHVLELAMTACPSKIIFGSDSPGVHPFTAVSSILPLRVSDEVKQMVFRDNLMRIVEK